ncbi:MAG: endo alpha-1,4 polygalactosaminidase [Spirochaetaceae bacterium]|nr:endo alpha-1,4 polygalactosaminidase [Spirochaetaceae bacterium]
MIVKGKYFVLLIIYGALMVTTSLSSEADESEDNIDYRYEMRSFVEKISSYGKAVNENFLIIPQNGQELFTYEGYADGEPVHSYINAIDGVGREDLFYGYTGDDILTPDNANEYMLGFLDLAEKLGIEVLTIDYCSTVSKMKRSYEENRKRGFISFSADSRGLDNIPHYPAVPYNENERDMDSLSQASNFLYLINPEKLPVRKQMISALSSTNFDLLIIDLFDNDGELLSSEDIESLKRKDNGGRRLVIAYMSIGEAEDYRYYWQNEWDNNLPVWIEKENPHWRGNYKVRYWEPTWQELILGSENSYLDLILKAGFDGVYLDIIDGFEYFEN